MRTTGKILVGAVLIGLVVSLAFWGMALAFMPTMLPIQTVPVLFSTPPPPPEVTLIAVGDVMLSRKVGRAINEYGTSYPFKYTASLLKSADITFGNLESPISTRGNQIPGKQIWFRADPKSIEALTEAGFDVLSVANNHALDYDSPAFLDTIEILEGAGIKAVGGGKNLTEARRPVIMEVNGITIGFLAYSELADIFWDHKYPRRFQATDTIVGVAPLVIEQIEEDIAALRQQVDYIAVSLHWGIEYKYHAEPYQKKLAHRMIDAGANFILGHHPHSLQGVEVYNHGLIAYSLGNFVFDQEWSEQTKQGLILTIKITPLGLEKAELIPVYIDKGQPVVAKGDMAALILNLTQEASSRLGTVVEIDGDIGVVKKNAN